MGWFEISKSASAEIHLGIINTILNSGYVELAQCILSCQIRVAFVAQTCAGIEADILLRYPLSCACILNNTQKTYSISIHGGCCICDSVLGVILVAAEYSLPEDVRLIGFHSEVEQTGADYYRIN